jgi:hypothetical protein
LVFRRAETACSVLAERSSSRIWSYSSESGKVLAAPSAGMRRTASTPSSEASSPILWLSALLSLTGGFLGGLMSLFIAMISSFAWESWTACF